ncbi:MAG: hypothetical protein R1F54_00840 [Candidatus Zeuxoniibacter abyssi]|nr:MAG: hypothetical protein R1F54_00840 [Candidatus Persebacteraceae bacterium AB1(2)]
MAKYGYRWEVFKMYGIEQKLKITRHAVGDGAAFDRVAYRAYGKRGYAITAIDLYSRIGLP